MKRAVQNGYHRRGIIHECVKGDAGRVEPDLGRTILLHLHLAEGQHDLKVFGHGVPVDPEALGYLVHRQALGVIGQEVIDLHDRFFEVLHGTHTVPLAM